MGKNILVFFFFFCQKNKNNNNYKINRIQPTYSLSKRI